ncbi:hypothetical protein [Streptomyces sp. NPDC048565]|uniref:hypothetical protein n=1 Tax=Streptomyces sp. NPDC048565 TaxID=3155266 RepID=UPI00341DBFC1
MFEEAGDVDGMDGRARPLRSSGRTGRAVRALEAVRAVRALQAVRAVRAARRLLALPLLGALVLALGPTGPAQAAAPTTKAAPATSAASACSGRLVKTVKFSTGSLRVYKSGAYACAVTVAKKPGARRAMRVSVQPRGGRAVVDSGKFTTLAGPVRVHALNRCVRTSGSVGNSSGSTGWIMC